MVYEISFLDDVESEFSDAITWYDEQKTGLYLENKRLIIKELFKIFLVSN
jgi:hypothetical protein